MEIYDSIPRNSLIKVTNVKLDNEQFFQAFLSAAKGGLGVFFPTVSLAVPTFLASAVGNCLK